MAPQKLVDGFGKAWEKMPAFAQIAIVLFSLPMGLWLFKASVLGQGDDVGEIRKNTDMLVSDMQYFKSVAIKADAENAVQNALISDITGRVKLSERAIESLERLHQTHQTQIDMLLQSKDLGAGTFALPDMVVGWSIDVKDPI